MLKLAEALNTKKYAALIFIDPFGMQINWKSIASLKGTRSDIWILIPSGVAVNRLLSKTGKVKNKVKLQGIQGINTASIRVKPSFALSGISLDYCQEYKS